MAIYPEILKLRVIVEDIQKDLARQKAMNGHLVGQSVGATIRAIAQISVPPMIDRNIDRLFMLKGLAGPSCLQLVGMIFQYNTFVDQLVSRMMAMSAAQSTAALSHLEDHLALIAKIIEKCEREVRPIHDAVKG